MMSSENPNNFPTIINSNDPLEGFLDLLDDGFNLDDFDIMENDTFEGQDFPMFPDQNLIQNSSAHNGAMVCPTKRTSSGKTIIAAKANRNMKLAKCNDSGNLLVIRKNNNGRKCVYRINGKKLKLPSLVKTDIRMSYANMFANVFNSHDEILISDFLQSHCGDECKMVNECAFAKDFNIPTRLEVAGRQLIFEFWHGRIIQFPDTVFQVEDAKVRTKYRPTTLENIGSTIEATMRISGTRVYELKRDDWLPSLKHYEDKKNQLQRLQNIKEGPMRIKKEMLNSSPSISSNCSTTSASVTTTSSVEPRLKYPIDSASSSLSNNQHSSHSSLASHSGRSEDNLDISDSSDDEYHSSCVSPTNFPTEGKPDSSTSAPVNSFGLNTAIPTVVDAKRGCTRATLIDYASVVSPIPMHMRSRVLISVDSNMCITGFEFISKPIPDKD